MYKGIVLKLTNEYALVLAEENVYYKIALKGGLFIGQRIFFFDEDLINAMPDANNSQASASIFWKKTASFSVMAACVLFFFLFGGVLGLPTGNNAYYAIVSVDINPSVEIKVNKDRYVVGVDALNAEGHKVSGQYILGMKLEDAVEAIVKNSAKYEYLQDNETVLLSASINPEHDKRDSYTDDNEENTVELIGALDEADLPEEYEYLFLPSEPKAYEKAKEEGISLGKYQATLLANETIKPEKVKEMKVKELLKDQEIQSELNEKNPKKAVWIDNKNNKTREDKDNDKDKDKIDKGNNKDKDKDNNNGIRQGNKAKNNDSSKESEEDTDNNNPNGKVDNPVIRNNESNYEYNYENDNEKKNK